MEKGGHLVQRAIEGLVQVTGANTNPVLEKVQADQAPKLAAHQDAIILNGKLFARVAAIYKQRDSLKLDAESLRLLQVPYHPFIRPWANLPAPAKTERNKLDDEAAA